MAAMVARRRGDSPPAERRGSAEGSGPGSTLTCKNRTKMFLVPETLELISQASFSRNLPEEALESNAIGRSGAHAAGGQTHRDVLPDSKLTFRPRSKSRGGKGRPSFLPPYFHVRLVPWLTHVLLF